MQVTPQASKATVMKLQGHINADNAHELKNQLTTAVSGAEAPMVLVDMEEVESLDSAGLMAFVSAMSLSKSVGRRFSLRSVSPSVRIIFELSQLDRVFDIEDRGTNIGAVLA
ncbi:STAS domain-containing protein [Oscillatoriales cyanobacterium LEGE 11467]|uniref:Anti-sigma factor antagonist n=1 Tax=Zarconia navalis LEGE 11467 TaxID=1828826 RepID=A0A928Z8Q7_9CYAN|nr:STAS domain-containing protein [Zarconia navalis]MBE9040839.1 STAS domain-containing protein [Zarconia navalis LEGE 11467]